MTTYYVRKTGLDANAGTSPATAWLTVGKAFSTMLNSDTCYVGAGTYSETRDTNTPDKTTAAKVIGDTDGSKTGDPGEVILSAWTSGYSAAPAALTLANLGRFWQLENLTLYGGGSWGSSGKYTVLLSRDNTLVNCNIYALGDQVAIGVSNSTVNPCNIVIEKCNIISQIETCLISVNPFTGSGDIDTNIIIRNNFIWGQTGAQGGAIHVTCAVSRKIGGVLAYHNTIINGANAAMMTQTTSTTIPCQAKYNLVYAGGVSTSTVSNPTFTAANLGELTEDYNYIDTPDLTPDEATYKNVTAGTHSERFTKFALINTGHRRKHGFKTGDIFAPVAGSPMIAFVTDGTDPITDDLYGNPRPTGNKTIGCVEPGRGWSKETGTVRTGANAISNTGWGYQDMDVAVDATSTTLSVYMRYDATYAGTLPQFQVLNGTECGVANATATQVGASGAWEQLSLTFTPTSAGIVTVRFISNDTNGAGKAFADDRNF